MASYKINKATDLLATARVGISSCTCQGRFSTEAQILDTQSYCKTFLASSVPRQGVDPIPRQGVDGARKVLLCVSTDNTPSHYQKLLHQLTQCFLKKCSCLKHFIVLYGDSPHILAAIKLITFMTHTSTWSFGQQNYLDQCCASFKPPFMVIKLLQRPYISEEKRCL